MKIILDIREPDLYEKCYSIINTEGNNTFIQLSQKALPLGDILITTDEDKDVLLIERKSFPDLLASIKDGRYEEQSYRLSHSGSFPLHNIMYLLEGMFSQVNNPIEKKLIYSTITSLNYFKGFSVMRTATVRESAEYIVWMANKIEKNFQKGKIPSYLLRQPVSGETESGEPTVSGEPIRETTVNGSDYCKVVKKVKKDNVTKENIGEIILCQIPGISSITAISIMKHFTSFPAFLEELKQNPQLLENMTMDKEGGKSRKIGKNCIENIKNYLLN